MEHSILNMNKIKLWQIWYKYMWSYKNINDYSQSNSGHFYQFFSVNRRIGQGKNVYDREFIAYYNMITKIYHFGEERFTNPDDMLDYIIHL